MNDTIPRLRFLTRRIKNEAHLKKSRGESGHYDSSHQRHVYQVRCHESVFRSLRRFFRFPTGLKCAGRVLVTKSFVVVGLVLVTVDDFSSCSAHFSAVRPPSSPSSLAASTLRSFFCCRCFFASVLACCANLARMRAYSRRVGADARAVSALLALNGATEVRCTPASKPRCARQVKCWVVP